MFFLGLYEEWKNSQLKNAFLYYKFTINVVYNCKGIKNWTDIWKLKFESRLLQHLVGV